MRMLRILLYIVYILVLVCSCTGRKTVEPAAVRSNEDIAKRLYQTGDSLYGNQMYSAAMRNYLDALRLAESDGCLDLAAHIYNGIGNLYSTQGDFQMGLYFYHKALNVNGKTNNKALRNAVFNNLVGTSCFLGNADSGAVFLERMEANVENKPGYRYNILMGHGLVAKTKNDVKRAAYYYIMARQYAGKSGLDSSYIDNTNSCLAQLYLDAGKTDSAIVLLLQNELWARKTSQDDLLAETMHMLAQAYDAKGDAAHAATCRSEYVELVDKMHNEDELNAMKNTQYLYDADKNANAISMLTEQKHNDTLQIRSQERWLIALGVALVLIVSLLVVVYMQKLQLYNAYNRLYDRSQLCLSSSVPLDEGSMSAGLADETGDDTYTSPTTMALLTEAQRDKLLADIKHVMECGDEFCMPDFTIDRLAQLVNSNSRYVSEAINEGCGKNFRTFLNEYRIKVAMRRLADVEHFGGFTIKAISESVGYKSQANFITVFTKLTGMKPSIYQKISRQRT